MSRDPFLEGCWRCGVSGVREADDGRRLCPSCRSIALGGASGYIVYPLTAYWDTLALERCWRCTKGVVEKSDDLGLCDECKEQLVDVTDS